MPSKGAKRAEQQRRRRENSSYREAEIAKQRTSRRRAVRRQPLLGDAMDIELNPPVSNPPSFALQLITGPSTLPSVPRQSKRWDRIPNWPSTWNRVSPRCNTHLLSSEASTFCCDSGKQIIPPLLPLPVEIQDLLDDPQAARVISGNSRRLNNLFSFTAIGFTGSSHPTPPDAHIAISGRSYHHMLHLNEGHHSLRWFLHDEAEREQHGQQFDVDAEWLDAFCTALNRINSFNQKLRTFASTKNVHHRALELLTPSAGGDFASVAHIANSTAFHPRQIVIWKENEEQPSFIDLLSPFYECLQYPVLMPYGETGWGLDDDNQSLYGLSQIQWYRS